MLFTLYIVLNKKSLKFRLERPQLPFTFVGMDYFGSYGTTIEWCNIYLISIPVIHILIAEFLTIDTTILALRTFIARKRTIWGRSEKSDKKINKEFEGDKYESYSVVTAGVSRVSYELVTRPKSFKGAMSQKVKTIRQIQVKLVT